MISSASLGEAVRRGAQGEGLRQDELAAAAGVVLRLPVEPERGKPAV
jgi:hypothetical protein